MAINGNQWQSMAINGNQWQSMAINGNQWQSMAINGNQLQSVAINGNQWQSMAIAPGAPRSRIGSGRRCGRRTPAQPAQHRGGRCRGGSMRGLRRTYSPGRSGCWSRGGHSEAPRRSSRSGGSRRWFLRLPRRGSLGVRAKLVRAEAWRCCAACAAGSWACSPQR